MSSIQGEKRETSTTKNVDYTKYVGLFLAEVIAINPNSEQYRDLLGREIDEDSKTLEYLGKNKDGNLSLRIDVWLKDVKTSNKFKTSFFLEDKIKQNKDKTKKQYINSVGACTWAADTNDFPTWFSEREYREAHVGEEELYTFLRYWLGNLDLRNKKTTLEVDFNKLMRNNLKDLTSQIGEEWATEVITTATVKTSIKEDGVKEYQSIWNKGFLPGYLFKDFKTKDYTNSKFVNSLRSKKPLNLLEKFAINISGEYGCKDYYVLSELTEYSPSDNIVSGDKSIMVDDDDMPF